MLLPTVRHVYLLLAIVLSARAASFDCHYSRPPLRWDLTSLNSVRTISRERKTPPTVMHDEVEFNLCGEIPIKSGVAATDQCPAGTRACYRTLNSKANENDRITRVIPAAGDITSEPTSSLDPSFRGGSADNSIPLQILLHGPIFPPDAAVQQSFNITLHCATSDAEPKMMGYNVRTGQLRVEWETRAGCSITDDGGDTDRGDGGSGGGGSQPARRGSGVGWFFLVLLIAILAYFGLGAYYNYSQYGASGWDLLPHRDFWRDVPYLLRDITSHLFSSIRPGGGRSGYTAV